MKVDNMEVGTIQDIERHTVIMLLCYQFHKDLPDKARAIKIARTAKYVRDNTKDKQLHSACKSLIKTAQKGDYGLVVEAMKRTQDGYILEGGYEKSR